MRVARGPRSRCSARQHTARAQALKAPAPVRRGGIDKTGGKWFLSEQGQRQWVRPHTSWLACATPLGTIVGGEAVICESLMRLRLRLARSTRLRARAVVCRKCHAMRRHRGAWPPSRRQLPRSTLEARSRAQSRSRLPAASPPAGSAIPRSAREAAAPGTHRHPTARCRWTPWSSMSSRRTSPRSSRR